jgi:hypothetical protein
VCRMLTTPISKLELVLTLLPWLPLRSKMGQMGIRLVSNEIVISSSGLPSFLDSILDLICAPMSCACVHAALALAELQLKTSTALHSVHSNRSRFFPSIDLPDHAQVAHCPDHSLHGGIP